MRILTNPIQDIGRRTLWIALAVIALAYVLLVGFPAERFTIEPGLDPSWTYGINLAANQGLVFGRDVVFTYGPFGYLRSPINIGDNLAKAIVFQLSLHAVLAVLLISILVKTRRVAPLVVWALGFSTALVVGLQYEYQMIGVAALLACASIHLFEKRWMLFSSGAFPAFIFFIRPGAGVLALSIVAGLIIVLPAAARKWFWLCTLFTASGAMATILVVLVFRFGSIQSFLSWLRLTAEIARGFDVAMNDPGPRIQTAFALVAALVFLSPIVVAPRSRQARLCIALLPAVFLCFKHNFVRQDREHIGAFFGLLMFFGAMLQLFVETRKERWNAVAVLICLALIGTKTALAAENLSWPSMFDVFSGRQGIGKLKATLALESQLAEFERISAQSLSVDRLPIPWREAIQKENGTVMPFPTEISYCPANHLPCRMYPTLQAYSAYTGLLDRWSASIFEGARAPDFVIVEFTSIDGRNVWFDVPVSLRALLAHYRLADSEDGKRLLFKKRELVEPARAEPLFHTIARLEEWTSVPSSEGIVVGAPQLKLSWLGWLAKTLFRIPPVYLEVRFRGGEVSRWRFVPSTASQGLMLGLVPRTGRELADISLGRKENPVAQFRIVAPRHALFENEFQLDWSVMELAPVHSGGLSH